MARLLIDAALSPALVAPLHAAGHDVVHVAAIGLGTATDEEILDRAVADGRAVVSADTDFSALLHQRGASRPSVILFRRGAERQPSEQVRLLLAHLPAIESDLSQGVVVIVLKDRIRVRKLPLTP